MTTLRYVNMLLDIASLGTLVAVAAVLGGKK